MRQICTRCHVEKDSEFFYRDKRSRSGLRSWCKVCELAYDKVYAATYRRQHPQETRARDSRRKERNRIRYREINRRSDQRRKVHKRLYRRLYGQSHPDQVRAWCTARRARKRNAPKVVPIKHIDIALRDNWRCHLCGKKVSRATWSLDHLIPLIRGGNHTPDNVALAHRVCNSRRGAGYLPAQLRLLG